MDALAALVGGRLRGGGVSHLRGTGVSPGIAVGRALVMERDAAPVFRLAVPAGAVDAEVRRLEEAIEASREQLRGDQGAAVAGGGGAARLHLRRPPADARGPAAARPRGGDRARARRQRGVGAAHGVREPARPLQPVQRRLPARAQHRPRRRASGASSSTCAARRTRRRSRGCRARSCSWPGDLTPSEAAELDWDRVLAIVTDVGSLDLPHRDHRALARDPRGGRAQGGHAADPARQPGGGGRDPRRGGGRALGAGARVLRGPRARLPARGGAAARDAGPRRRGRSTASRCASRPTSSSRRRRRPRSCTAREGIGLFRSEYLLGRGLRCPTEEQQLDVYRRLLEQMHPHPVTVRTWDVGLEALGPSGPSSPNPALGERALRLLRRSPEPFRVQLRALLRAGLHGPVRIMFPFVSGPGDLRLALALLERVEGGAARAREWPFARTSRSASTSRCRARPWSPTCWRRRWTSSAWARTTSSSTCWRWTGRTRASPSLYEPLHPAVLRTLRGDRARRPRPTAGRSRSAARWRASRWRRCCWWASASASCRWPRPPSRA